MNEMKLKVIRNNNLVKNKNNLYKLTLPEINHFKKITTKYGNTLTNMTPYQIYEINREKSMNNIKLKPHLPFEMKLNIHHYTTNSNMIKNNKKKSSSTQHIQIIDSRNQTQRSKKKIRDENKTEIIQKHKNFLQLSIIKCNMIKKGLCNNGYKYSKKNKITYKTSSVQTMNTDC